MNEHAPLHLEVFEAGHPPTPVQLTGGQQHTLLAASHLVKLSGTTGGRCNVEGKRRVGLVRLGSGADEVVLHLRTKLPINNLLYLLGRAAASGKWYPAQIDTSADGQLVPAVARMFADAARDALNGGVLHGYLATADLMPAVRGRIDIPAQLRRYGSRFRSPSATTSSRPTSPKTRFSPAPSTA